MRDKEGVFTPLDKTRKKRLSFPISSVEIIMGDIHARILGSKAIVRIGKKVYKVVGIECGLEGCNCDSYITDELITRS